MVVLAGCDAGGGRVVAAVLVVGRAMQGVGLGLVPLAMAAARDALPAPRRPAIALLSVAAAAGVGAGYPISGFIAEHMGLSAAYWFGAIFSALALAARSPWCRGRDGHRRPPRRRGAVLLSAGLVALLLAIGQGGAWGWTSPAILSLLAVGGRVIARLGASVQLRVPRRSSRSACCATPRC